jgi:hypothetical protein
MTLFQIFVTAVVDTGGKFTSGIVDNGGNLPLESTTQRYRWQNLLPVTPVAS